ncbi:hypothetical protein OUZ56_026039 [Daphnia magna]|uniref:Uncharacterized protein n=1 Tax=Daphnia magna TaxID=35525 RepID=A0ABQ9ZKN1_9CRUS|nr:hypothetical protein OUZ56_026039 [Daphnia magna]
MQKEIVCSMSQKISFITYFHQRTFYIKDTVSSSKPLPTNFVDCDTREITVQRIPVACKVTYSCPLCCKSGTLLLNASGKDKSKVMPNCNAFDNIGFV